jgi:rod shape-determining protein MreB
MMGRTPGHIQAVRPLKDGVIADFEICEKMLRFFIQKVHRSRWVKPRMVICVPSGITGVEQRAVQGARPRVRGRPQAGLHHRGADGRGDRRRPARPGADGQHDRRHRRRHRQVAVISLGGIVASQSVRVAGDELDEAVINYIKKEFSLAIGEQTAEDIKTAMGSAWPLTDELSAEVRGRDLVSGLPQTVEVTSEQIREALEEPVAAIVDAVKTTLDKTPPELAADIMEGGITITGAARCSSGLDVRIEQETGMPINLAPIH